MLSIGESRIVQEDGKKDNVDYVVKKLCQHIRSNLTSDEWCKFEEQKTDRGRIELFVQNEEIQSCVKKYLGLHPTNKDKAKALILKSLGTRAFGAGDDEKALSLYTQSLVWMPHDGTKDVGIIYANRAACLFHLNFFSLAENDVELAFSFNYPPELHYKLHDRLGRCCLQLGKASEAVKHLQRAIKSLQTSGLDQSKIMKAKKTFEELIQFSPNSSNGSFTNQNKSSSKIAGSQQLSDLPEVVGGRSKYLRSASQGLTLRSTEKQGRFVVANESFRPGDVILVEKAYTSILLPEHYHRQCFQCYSEVHAPVPCQSCIFASFCSKKCREEARKTHHKYECKILGLLKNSGISVICYMALRILTQSDPKEASKWYEMAKKTEMDELSKMSLASEGNSDNCGNKTSKVTQTQGGFGFNEEYRTDHVALFHLVTHKNVRSAEELFHHTVMALYLLHALKATTYLSKAATNSEPNGGHETGKEKGQETSGPMGDQQSKNISGLRSQEELRKTSISQNETGKSGYKDNEEDVSLDVKFAVLLLRFLQFLPFNAHETSGWNPFVEKDNSVGLGGGIFPTLALFNHSCNPAIVRYFINDTVVVRAVKTILPGEIVTENYGQVFSATPKKERQAKLLDHYWFQCECVACREDWPTYENMEGNDKMSFRCEHCRTFICKADENMGILFRCGKCQKSVNILKSLKAISESDVKYNQAVKFIDNGKLETGLGILLENISLLDTYLIPPFRDYHLCQEQVRKCMLNLGNKASNLPAWNPENVDIAVE